MESISFSINYTKRLQRAHFIRFFDLLYLYLSSGFEMNHAWNQSMANLRGETPDSLHAILHTKEPGIEEHLRRLSKNTSLGLYACWFKVLATLYESGAEMAEAVKGISTSLRKEELIDLEKHLRDLPTRTQIILILFFFPPTMLLIIVPSMSRLVFGD